MSINDLNNQNNDQNLLFYDTSGNLEYVCFARPGAATSEPVWRILKLSYDSGNLSVKKWANGSPAYAFVADSRTGYTYA